MKRTPYESEAALTSATDPEEFNVVSHSRPKTDSYAALLPYLTHQFGSAHEWSRVWNGANSCRPLTYVGYTCMADSNVSTEVHYMR